MVLTGNVALESMGFETFGFAGGREDVWEPDEDVYWGPETTWLGDERYSGERELEKPFGAVQMGLIYVNPEGPNGNPDPLAAAVDIRETFRRMAMNDEETVALIAGGHTFGKTHGAADPDEYVGPEPEGAPLEAQGLGWSNRFGTRQGRGRDHQRHRGHLDRDADAVEQQLLREPVRLRVGADQEPRRRAPVAAEGRRRRRARSPGRRRTPTARPPTMLTTDLALRFDPVYEPISRRFLENPDELADAFARAWFKLTHRDMGPIARYLGPEVPDEELIWQDPVPAVDHELIGDGGRRRAQGARSLESGLSVSAAGLDRVGVGLDVPRQRQARRRQRRAHPARAAERLGGQRPRRAREGAARRSRRSRRRLRQAGLARRPDRARRLRRRSSRPRADGRRTTSRSRSRRAAPTRRRSRPTSSRSRALEPTADGFRNYLRQGHPLPAEYLLLDRANLLTLSAPEMTVLVGGLRVLGANHGRLVARRAHRPPGTLTNDFFVNLLDLGTEWNARPGDEFEARDALPATSRGPAAAPTSCSARTPSCARSPRSTPATTRARSSCATSSRRGSRS